MNLRHLEVFHAIMQAGSVTGAAHLLNVTQPAISNVLRHAEQKAGFKLFERIGGRLHPTPEAADLLPDVEEIFGRIDTLNRTVDEMRDGRHGRLAIAASPTFVNAYLPKAVARLRREAPGARVTIHALPTAKMTEERVARREVDIGLVYADVTDPNVAVEEIARSTVLCALPRDSPLAGREFVETGDLASVPVVATGPASRVGAAIARGHAARGLPMPAVSVEVNALQAACLMAAEGVGVGLVDQATVDQYPLSDVVFRPLRPRIELSMCLIRPKDRPRSRLSLRFAECLRALFRPDGSQ